MSNDQSCTSCDVGTTNGSCITCVSSTGPPGVADVSDCDDVTCTYGSNTDNTACTDCTHGSDTYASGQSGSCPIPCDDGNLGTCIPCLVSGGTANATNITSCPNLTCTHGPPVTDNTQAACITCDNGDTSTTDANCPPPVSTVDEPFNYIDEEGSSCPKGCYCMVRYADNTGSNGGYFNHTLHGEVWCNFCNYGTALLQTGDGKRKCIPNAECDITNTDHFDSGLTLPAGTALAVGNRECKLVNSSDSSVMDN